MNVIYMQRSCLAFFDVTFFKTLDVWLWSVNLLISIFEKSRKHIKCPQSWKIAGCNFFFFSLKQSWKLQMSSFAALFPALLPHSQYKETSSRLLFSCLYFKRLLFGVFLNSSGNAFKWKEWYRAVLTAKWTLHIPVESSLILFKKPWCYCFLWSVFSSTPHCSVTVSSHLRSLCPAAQRDPNVQQMVLYLCLITEQTTMLSAQQWVCKHINDIAHKCNTVLLPTAALCGGSAWHTNSKVPLTLALALYSVHAQFWLHYKCATTTNHRRTGFTVVFWLCCYCYLHHFWHTVYEMNTGELLLMTDWLLKPMWTHFAKRLISGCIFSGSSVVLMFYSCPLPIHTARVGKRSKVLYLCALSLTCLRNLYFWVQDFDMLTQQLQHF